jgi:hypothetical protein
MLCWLQQEGIEKNKSFKKSYHVSLMIRTEWSRINSQWGSPATTQSTIFTIINKQILLHNIGARHHYSRLPSSYITYKQHNLCFFFLIITKCTFLCLSRFFNHHHHWWLLFTWKTSDSSRAAAGTFQHSYRPIPTWQTRTLDASVAPPIVLRICSNPQSASYCETLFCA